jgi:broad specificity phosphatase PhoE
MTTIVLVRHGEVEGIHPPRFRGRTDLPLTKRGMLQAQATRDALRERCVLDAIYCSPLTRCVHTADIIATAYGIDAVPQPGLLDIDYGVWTGMEDAVVRQRWPQEFALWRECPHTFRLPGGETLQELQTRAVEALQTMLEAHPNGTFAIVGHDSINRVLLCHIAALPLASYRLFKQAPCGISEIASADGHFVIHSVNETMHLHDIA